MESTPSFTQRVVAELAPHTPLLSCCRRSLVEGLALVTTTRGVIATTRPVAVRAAIQALHAERITAHVSRVGAARRVQYELVGIEPEVVQTPSMKRVLSPKPAARRVPRLGPPRAPGRRAISRDRLRGRRPAPRSWSRISQPSASARGPGSGAVDGSSPSDPVAAVGAALSSIGAQAGRLAFESGRVIREVRSGVNRRLNAETANLRRTATAGVRQLESISVLEADQRRWQSLPPALREAAELRAGHPDDDLAQLAERAGCSRPAMAGRLHRLVAAAGEGGDRVNGRRSSGVKHQNTGGRPAWE